MTVMWASGFARVGDDDYYARDQPQERCPCHRGENEWRGTDYPFGSQLSIERHVERLARDRDVDDAQRRAKLTQTPTARRRSPWAASWSNIPAPGGPLGSRATSAAIGKTKTR